MADIIDLNNIFGSTTNPIVEDDFEDRFEVVQPQERTFNTPKWDGTTIQAYEPGFFENILEGFSTGLDRAVTPIASGVEWLSDKLGLYPTTEDPYAYTRQQNENIQSRIAELESRRNATADPFEQQVIDFDINDLSKNLTKVPASSVSEEYRQNYEDFLRYNQDNSGATKWAGTIAEGFGESIPLLLSGAAGAGAKVAAGIQGLNTGTNTTLDALDQGASSGRALGAGAVSGVFEGVTSVPFAKMLGGGKVLSNIAEGGVSNAVNALGQTASQDIISGELSNFSDYGLNALTGGVTGVGLGAAFSAAGKGLEKINKKLKKPDDSIQSIKDTMDALSEDIEETRALPAPEEVKQLEYNPIKEDIYTSGDDGAASGYIVPERKRLANPYEGQDILIDAEGNITGVVNRKPTSDLSVFEVANEDVPMPRLENTREGIGTLPEYPTKALPEPETRYVVDENGEPNAVIRNGDAIPEQDIFNLREKDYTVDTETYTQKPIIENGQIEGVEITTKPVKVKTIDADGNVVERVQKPETTRVFFRSLDDAKQAKLDQEQVKLEKENKVKSEEFRKELKKEGWEYDKDGNLVDIRKLPKYYNLRTKEFTHKPIYDDSNNVIGVERTYKPSEQYTFDDDGNMIPTMGEPVTEKVYFDNESIPGEPVDTTPVLSPEWDRNETGVVVNETTKRPIIKEARAPKNKKFNSVAELVAFKEAQARQASIDPVTTKVEKRVRPQRIQKTQEELLTQVSPIDSYKSEISRLNGLVDKVNNDIAVGKKDKTLSSEDIRKKNIVLKILRSKIDNLNSNLQDIVKAEQKVVRPQRSIDKLRKKNNWGDERGAVVNPIGEIYEGVKAVGDYFKKVKDSFGNTDPRPQGDFNFVLGESPVEKFTSGALFQKKENGRIVGTGVNIPVISNVMAFSRKVFSLPSTLAQKFPEHFGGVFKAGQNVIKIGHQNLVQFSEPYLQFASLPKESQARVGEALEHARMLRLSGKNFAESKQNWMASGLNEAEADVALSLRQAFNDAIEKIRQGKKAEVRMSLLQSRPRKAPQFENNILKQQYADIDNFCDNLYNTNYTPFSRRGKYYLDAPDANYFMMSDNRADIEAKARELSSQGIRSQSGTTKKYFRDDKLFQPYVMQAVSEYGAPVTGFEGHLKKAKGVEGESTDYARNYAEYFNELANWHSDKVGGMQLEEAIQNMPKSSGDNLISYARKYQKDLFTKTNKAISTLKSLTAMSSLSNPVTAMVNMTQPLTMTIPETVKYLGLKNGHTAYYKALKSQLARATNQDKWAKQNQELATAIKRAEELGILDAGQADVLRDASKGIGKTQNAIETTLLWGFSTAEKVNRLNAFMTGWEVAERSNMTNFRDKFNFAEKFVNDTQFNYNKADRPEATRGALGVPTMFKIYQGCMWRALRDGITGDAKSKIATLERLGIMALIGGVGSVPFESDLNSIIYGATGIDIESRAKKELQKLFGKDSKTADVFTYGLGILLGVNTKANTASEGYLGMINPTSGDAIGQSFAKAIGGAPYGTFVTDPMNALYLHKQGRDLEAVGRFMPKILRNPIAAYKAYDDAAFRDLSGNNIVADPSAKDIALRSFGIQPQSMTEYYEAKNGAWADVNNKYKDTTRIARAAEIVRQADSGKLDPETAKPQLEALIQDEMREKGREREKVLKSIQDKIAKQNEGVGSLVKNLQAKPAKTEYLVKLAKESPSLLMKTLQANPKYFDNLLAAENDEKYADDMSDVMDFVRMYKPELQQLLAQTSR